MKPKLISLNLKPENFDSVLKELEPLQDQITKQISEANIKHIQKVFCKYLGVDVLSEGQMERCSVKHKEFDGQYLYYEDICIGCNKMKMPDALGKDYSYTVSWEFEWSKHLTE